MQFSNIKTTTTTKTSIIVFILCFCCLLQQINTQMTFSDGWGKRSVPSTFALRSPGKRHPPPDFVPLSGERGPVNDFLGGGDEEALNPAMEACHVGYAQRLVQLHEQMLFLYGTYQQCQIKAMGTQPKAASPKS
ncbi:hypothetical protein Mgra_00007964 [Meloidogyne graminicola]|uniref:Uncharacterized protein n=1 Tax=Meloidogyne graminicola TaxID=189291 RepID=A0A8S9ZH47_9BILA|nr:hypothetical protein Mgra_00007964 [Meloidogyne graminicola]